MTPQVEAKNVIAAQVEFVDGLRAYRFAAALRASEGKPDVRVWHVGNRVVVGIAGKRPPAASLAMLQAQADAVANPAG